MNPLRYKTWSPPAGLVIQPDCLLVPGRGAYTGASPFGRRGRIAVVPFLREYPTHYPAAYHLDQCADRPGVPVPVDDDWVEGEEGESPLPNYLQSVSIPHWNLNSLTETDRRSLLAALIQSFKQGDLATLDEHELNNLQVAIDEQRNRGIKQLPVLVG